MFAILYDSPTKKTEQKLHYFHFHVVPWSYLPEPYRPQWSTVSYSEGDGTSLSDSSMALTRQCWHGSHHLPETVMFHSWEIKWKASLCRSLPDHQHLLGRGCHEQCPSYLAKVASWLDRTSYRPGASRNLEALGWCLLWGFGGWLAFLLFWKCAPHRITFDTRHPVALGKGSCCFLSHSALCTRPGHSVPGAVKLRTGALEAWAKGNKPREQWFDFMLHKHFVTWKTKPLCGARSGCFMSFQALTRWRALPAFNGTLCYYTGNV